MESRGCRDGRMLRASDNFLAPWSNSNQVDGVNYSSLLRETGAARLGVTFPYASHLLFRGEQASYVNEAGGNVGFAALPSTGSTLPRHPARVLLRPRALRLPLVRLRVHPGRAAPPLRRPRAQRLPAERHPGQPPPLGSAGRVRDHQRRRRRVVRRDDRCRRPDIRHQLPAACICSGVPGRHDVDAGAVQPLGAFIAAYFLQTASWASSCWASRATSNSCSTAARS